MKIGITGGIGSGKSYICRLLAEQGYSIYSCDEAAKRLMACDETLRQRICQEISEEAYVGSTPNKAFLISYLFGNESNAQKLNSIVHPAVKADFLQWAECQQSPCFMECAILFESGFDSVVDHTILIHADENVRLARAMHRDNATAEQIRQRMNMQICPEKAQQLADYVFDNSGHIATETEMQRMLQWIDSLV